VRKFPSILLLVGCLLILIAVCGHGNAKASSGPGPAIQATIAPSIFIQSPREGQALQGVETIEGKIRGDGLLEGKVSFSYAGQSGGDETTWFFIADIEPEVEDSSQASFKINWDTSQITDGNYDLRVVARYRGGGAIFELVPNIRIRNLSAVETPTPGPAPVGETQAPTEPAASPVPVRDAPTALPPNPVVLESESLFRTWRGVGIGVAVLFLLGGIYWFIQNRSGS
jgi:hypothetical protein